MRSIALSLSLVFSFVLLVGAGCASRIKVATDFDPNFDFSQVRSFAWLDDRSGVEGDRADVSSLLDQRIRSAIEADLLGKGLALADQTSADVLVSYHLGVEQKLDVNTIHTGYGYGYGYRRGYGYRGVGTTTTVDQYEEGTLLIDLIQPGDKQLVWRGSGRARVKQSTTPEERDQRVREAVTVILAGFPPTPKTK